MKKCSLSRPSNVAHSANMWEIPGGRLEVGEDPVEGVQRETREETGLSVDVHEPIGVRSFTRDDGQHITMIMFRCSARSGKVELSKEHTEFAWKTMEKARELVHDAFGPQFDTYERYYKNR